MRYLLLLLLTTSLWGQTMGNKAEKLKVFYDQLNKDTLNLVDDFYHAEVEFADPISKIKGAKEIKAYYAQMYENVKEIKFDFKDSVESGNKLVAVWIMTLKTDKLNGGDPFTVEGTSVLHFDESGKATYHRDYFDMGEFIYERVAGLGYIVRKVKARMEHKPKDP